MNALRALHRIVEGEPARTEPRAPRPRPPASCELCGAPIDDSHRHVVDRDLHHLACACGACAVLFEHGDGETARYLSVPTRVLADGAGRLTAQDLAALEVPVGLAVLFKARGGAAVALYPGAAGIVESELAPTAWDALAAATPLAALAAPEVEAVLVHAERGAARVACYLIPIDLAYDLAGRLRRTWQGFSGGEAAHRELAAFFAELDRRSAPRGRR
jgi:hypothetical protein